MSNAAANNTTENDSPATEVDSNITPMEAEVLDKHLVRLMWEEPFFSHVLRGITKTCTRRVPTAGVLAKDGDIKLWWNPDFLGGLSTEQVKGLLKHEAFHLIFEHTTTRRHEPHKVWNYAADLAINSLIPESELPAGGLIPGQAFQQLTPEQAATWEPAQLEARNKLSDLIASFPKGQSGEWYFAEIMKIKDELGDLTGEGGGEGQPGFDDHDGWDQLSEEERELLGGKIKQAVAEAAKKADGRANGWGSVSAETRAAIRAALTSEVPWQTVLAQFVGFSRRANRDSTHKRLNKKYIGVHPGAKRGYTSHIAVYIDQSGSVGDDALEAFYGELMVLSKRTEFTIFNFDTEVDLSSERVWKRSSTKGCGRTRCGGTDFSAPSRHAAENRSRFDGYLILTDGEAADPGPSVGIRRGWIICPNNQLAFPKPSGDVLVQMTGKKA